MRLKNFLKSTGIIFSLCLFSFIISSNFVLADNRGEVKTFFVNKEYDLKQRQEVKTILKETSSKAYFYVEKNWYDNLTEGQKKEVRQKLSTLSQEFTWKIYPKLTTFYGTEWRPGIDNDTRITIVFHQLKKGVAGYFNSADEYEKLQSPYSNEREMVYLNTKTLFSPLLKSYLAHEFTHLITFFQKDKTQGKEEDTWLNEARADYSPTFLGYDDQYQKSNLQTRIVEFIKNPNDSLIEWRNEKKDYGVASAFVQYLIGHYGPEILADSLESSLSGIPSINYALKKNGIKKHFSDIFTDWVIAVFLNDCSFGEYYCYENKDLKNIKIAPSLIFLPSTQKTNISLSYFIKPWSGNWYKIIGAKGDLSISFDSQNTKNFIIPYILCDDNNNCQINTFSLENNKKIDITFNNFGEEWTSITLMPILEDPTMTSNKLYSPIKFSLSISLKNNKEELIQSLLKQIEELKAMIAEVQAKIMAILNQRQSCNYLSNNLYLGMKNNEVACLQNFLRKQGNIYPQGIVSGWFGPLTKQAVIRFQEKYADEILKPLGLEKGTGYVGLSTRKKINELLRVNN